MNTGYFFTEFFVLVKAEKLFRDTGNEQHYVMQSEALVCLIYNLLRRFHMFC